MKKTALFLLFCLSSLLLSAQFSSDSKHKFDQYITTNHDTVWVMMFNGITSNTDITYTGAGNKNDIKWYKYADLNTPVKEGASEIYNPDDTTGYVVSVNGKKFNLWVIDYKNYLPVLKSIVPDPQSSNTCKELNLLIDENVSVLKYRTPTGNSYILPRNFTLKYYTQTWKADDKKWDQYDSIVSTIALPATHVLVTAPLLDTKFILSGDQYALGLGIDTISKSSELYSAVAVECHLTTVVTSRKSDKNNEASAPTDAQPISYSVPIDVEFLSNANVPVATFYNWTIYKDDQLIVNRTDRDHRYTFTDYGIYKVKVVASNGTCSYADSTTVNAYEAAIQVPNVFTPNGDKVNDEFRIAYKSLLEFECWVYNRWGRQVYYWNNPQKGWDGKINGQDAAEGAYYYVIKATGYGLEPKKGVKVKSTVILKGDINLLRGKKQ